MVFKEGVNQRGIAYTKAYPAKVIDIMVRDRKVPATPYHADA